MENSPPFDVPQAESPTLPLPLSRRASVLDRESGTDARRAETTPAAGTLGATRPEADAGRATAPLAAYGAVVVDALLEPELVAARDRRAEWARSRVPFVSLAILAAILCAAWLL